MSPIKVAFSVTVRSVLVRITAYSIRSAIFPSAGVVISFSSGIIILFCYCAIITNHERKNYNNNIIIFGTVVITPIIILLVEASASRNNIKSSIVIRSSPFIIRAMCVIVIAIICINKRIFSPLKSLIASY